MGKKDSSIRIRLFEEFKDDLSNYDLILRSLKDITSGSDRWQIDGGDIWQTNDEEITDTDMTIHNTDGDESFFIEFSFWTELDDVEDQQIVVNVKEVQWSRNGDYTIDVMFTPDMEDLIQTIIFNKHNKK